MRAFLDKVADAMGSCTVTLEPETPEERAALDVAIQAKASVSVAASGNEVVVRLISTVGAE